MSAHTVRNRPSRHKTNWATRARGNIGVSDQADADEILALLDDQYAQVILQQTRNNAMSAKEISETCDISISTVYRRTERLIECGLLAERRVARPDGTHHSLYEAQLNELTVRLTDDGFEILVSRKTTADLADRFTDMWEAL
jgi:predicted transcriptional regulator